MAKKIKSTTSIGGGRHVREYEDGTKEVYRPGVTNPSPETLQKNQAILNRQPISNSSPKFYTEGKQVSSEEYAQAKERAKLNIQVAEGRGRFPMENKAKEEAKTELEQQQSEENRKLQEEFITNEPVPGFVERQKEAGAAAYANIANLVPSVLKSSGINVQTADTEGVLNTVGKIPIAGTIGLALLGALSTTGIAGVNLASIVGMGREVSTIKGDISDITRASSTTLEAAKNNKDYAGGIAVMKQLEASVRAKYGDLQIAMQMSPKDRQTGEDASEYIFKQLQILQYRRQILEQTALTGNEFFLDGAIL